MHLQQLIFYDCNMLRVRILILMVVMLICGSAWATSKWEDSISLKEIVVSAKDRRMLHVVAYVRDYSLLYTYTDTAVLYREKWIDFMLPAGKKSRYKGWTLPRLLSTKSYYHFRNQNGLDSVSDQFNQHFTWSDWIGLINPIPIPKSLQNEENVTDTVFGKYSPARIWLRNGDQYTLKVNAVVDTTSRMLIPGLSAFFRKPVNVFEDEGNDWWNHRNALEFDKFKLNYHFGNVVSDTLFVRDLERITCNVESQGRGRNMFRFNPYDEQFYVDTNYEIYIVAKEYIPVKDAKKWEHHQFTNQELENLPLPDIVPPVSDDIAQLINRVDILKEQDEANVRAHIKVDRRVAGLPLEGYTNKEVILKILKNMIGLKSKHKYNSKKNEK